MIKNGKEICGDVDPTDIVALPADTKDQSLAARRIRGMVGDQLAELSWWRPECS